MWFSGSGANRVGQRAHSLRAAEATRGPGWNISTLIERARSFEPDEVDRIWRHVDNGDNLNNNILLWLTEMLQNALNCLLVACDLIYVEGRRLTRESRLCTVSAPRHAGRAQSCLPPSSRSKAAALSFPFLCPALDRATPTCLSRDIVAVHLHAAVCVVAYVAHNARCSSPRHELPCSGWCCVQR